MRIDMSKIEMRTNFAEVVMAFLGPRRLLDETAV
jgi:hypothetical protein